MKGGHRAAHRTASRWIYSTGRGEGNEMRRWCGQRHGGASMGVWPIRCVANFLPGQQGGRDGGSNFRGFLCVANKDSGSKP